MDLWSAIGIAVAGYTALSVVRGEVHAKKGAGMETLARSETPARFWTVIALYAGLSVALFTVF